MSSVDTGMVVVILVCGVMGAYWGFIRQLLSIVGLIAGAALASRYDRAVGDAISSVIADPVLASAAGFVLVFLAVSTAASLVASMVREFAGLLFLGPVDHLLGAALGVLQGILVCAMVVITAATFSNPLWAPYVQESVVAPLIARAGGGILLTFLPETFHYATQRMFGSP